MSDNRLRCPHCHRHVDLVRHTGVIVGHRTKPGRRGSYCQGSGTLPDATPERGAA